MNYHRNEDYPPYLLGNSLTVVPQAVYNRAPAAYPAFPSITFFEGEYPGVSLRAALNGRIAGVVDGDTRPTTTLTSTKIKIRIMVWRHQCVSYNSILTRIPL